MHSVEHLRKRLNSAKFGPDPNEQKYVALLSWLYGLCSGMHSKRLSSAWSVQAGNACMQLAALMLSFHV